MTRLITVLNNKGIESSSVPVQWKQAIVTPAPKQKPHFLPSFCSACFVQGFEACIT